MATSASRRSQPVHDPRVLRAIAHPVRNRILAELSASGPLRAADIARELDVPANQASFHLRQLAKYGVVEEDPEAARDKRDRVWRLVAEEGLTVNLAELEAQPGGRAAATVWRRSASAWAHAVVDRAYTGKREKDTFSSITDHPIRLTKAEAEELARDLDEVLVRWTERTRGRGDSDERRTYLLFQILQPHPDR